MKRVGHIGNFYKIPEYILYSEFVLEYVIVEDGCLSDEMLTFLKFRNIPFVELANKSEIVKIICEIKVDFWITCSYGKRIPIEEMANVEIYNIHYAALPKYKGRHPTFYATMADEKRIGISLHKVTPHLDEGDIIAQQFVPYYIWENENNLFEKLTDKVPLLLKRLNSYLKGTCKECIKNSEGNYFSPVAPKDYTIDPYTDSPDVIFNKVRAQAKYRGALLENNGEKYWVNNVYFLKEEHQNKLCIKKEDYYIIFDSKKIS